MTSQEESRVITSVGVDRLLASFLAEPDAESSTFVRCILAAESSNGHRVVGVTIAATDARAWGCRLINAADQAEYG